MKYKFRIRSLGIFFVAFSLLGIVFSLSGILITWFSKPPIQKAALNSLTSLEDVLTITSESFAVMNNAIENAKDDLDIIEASLDGLHLAFDSINESLDLSGDLIGDDLRLIAINSQTALYASSTAAEVIHNTLSGISKIRLLGLDYAPEVPLHIGLVQIADNLSEVPDSLDAIEQSLDKTTDGIEMLNTKLTDLSGNIRALNSDLEDAQKVLNDYESTFQQINTQIIQLQKGLPISLSILSILISGLFFWVGLSQISILIQGISYLKGPLQIVNIADLHQKIDDGVESEIDEDKAKTDEQQNISENIETEHNGIIMDGSDPSEKENNT